MGKKKWLGILLILCAGLAAGAGWFAEGSAAVSGGRAKGEERIHMEVDFLRVGKADAMVLTEGGHTVVIDCGEEDDGQELVDFLTKQDIDTVELLIITHFDQDHVGGADLLLEQKGVEEVILPDYPGSGSDYAELLEVLSRRRVKTVLADQELARVIGSMKLLIEPPASYEMPEPLLEYDNDFSLITTVTHGDNRLFFTGDIEKQRITEWLRENPEYHCDFLKVPHHGIYQASLEAFFETVRPKYAVICDSDKNPADRETMELLKSQGSQVYETRFGRITLTSDGRRLEVSQKLR